MHTSKKIYFLDGKTEFCSNLFQVIQEFENAEFTNLFPSYSNQKQKPNLVSHASCPPVEGLLPPKTTLIGGGG